MFPARSPWRHTPTTARAAASAVLLAAALLPGGPARAAAGDPVVVPADGLLVHHLALSAGVLAIAGSAPGAGYDTVRTSVVSGAGELTVTAAADGADTGSAMPIARSGIRVAHTEPTGDQRYDVVISGPAGTEVRLPGALAGAGRLQLAGPYTLAGDTVYGAGGAVLARTEPGLAAVLDGQRLVWASAEGTVRVRDLQLPLSGKNPRVIAGTGCTAGCALSLAAAGNTVALARSDAAGIDLLDLVGAPLGTVATGAAPHSLTAAGSAVAWIEGDGETGSLRFSPLDAPAAATLATVATAVPPVLDDNLLAWVDPAGDVGIAALPGVEPGPALLLGSAAHPAFSPNADTARDTWSLPIWSSKPLGAVRLTLTSQTGQTQRTDLTPQPAGTEVSLWWDGTTTNGSGVPDGVYTWTLQADAADGSGPLLAADGSRPSGLVTVARHSPGPFAAPPAVSTGRTVRGAWGLVAPRFGITARYDVRVRRLRVGAPGGVKIPATLAGRTVLSATAATAAPLVANQPAGSVWQLSVRATDSAGNGTTWSPWRTTTVS